VQSEVGRPRPSQSSNPTRDDVYWAAIITVITSAMLISGRYSLVQSVAVGLVATFTCVTVLNLFGLQYHDSWAVRWEDLRVGFSFDLPRGLPGAAGAPVATALATFGIIGVGASEIVAYPYWCLEKGYARFTGPRENTEGWAERARGWLRVMRWDAWCSMVIYTFGTIAFYLLGAAVLHRQQLNPAEDQLIYVLSKMYEPVFGTWAQLLFLFGAFAVLYSTFFVASAGNARVMADAIRVFGLIGNSPESRARWTRIFCGLFPFVSLIVYRFVRAPATLILASGIIQAIMLPMLGAAALYFRYRRCDQRICPGTVWDVFLWVSAGGLLIAGGWAALVKLFPQIQLLGS
jgi:Mn2+/Fe2+ NRAMP family transporter